MFGLPTESVVAQVGAFVSGAADYVEWLAVPLALALGLVILGTVGNITHRLFRKEGN